MARDIITWIVEEVNNETGAVYTNEFETYSEAVEMYNRRKQESLNSISLTKTERKFLLE